MSGFVRLGTMAAAGWLVCGAWGAVWAVQPDPRGIEFFETKIRPVLVAHCYDCHSARAAKVKGGLLLDSRAGIRQGGDTGPAVVPGKVAGSLLIEALRHQGDMKMPPKGKLPEHVIADFVRWVEMGAPDPREGPGAKAYKTLTLTEAKSFWSFQPPRKHEPPRVKNEAWPRGPIDRFVLARLEEKGLKPGADADRPSLLRRLSFDLIGLPPTLEEMEAFANDTSAQAVEKAVDRLLASPHFGERWGRHWLDVARYAESNGNADNTPFPYAYRFRDWVIAAVNADKPYDRFVAEQIAGDLLAAGDGPARDQQLIATGFLALTSKPRAQNNPDYRHDLIADQIDVTSRAVLGLTVLCARCHDHKFDPIAQKEYYGLAGIFDSTVMLFGAGGKGAKGGGGFHSLSDSSMCMGVRDGKPVDSNLLIRGEAQRPSDRVPRGFLTVASLNTAPGAVNRQQSGRLELAHWLTSPENPLTARVAVNRVWQHLFGQGLVRTPDNFGYLGEAPSHPELLDHLALGFLAQGWSHKKLIREIVLTRTYQLHSGHDRANYKIDPDNQQLWRARTRRLDAEAIRDAVLVVSGRLDRAPLRGSALGQTNAMKKKGAFPVVDNNHRSVYLGMVRGSPLPEILSLFDVANPNLVVAQREVTTVPAQALYLMNSPFITEQARFFAQRLLAQDKLEDRGRVDLAYRLALSRPATAGEAERVLAYLAEVKDQGQLPAWTSFCQTLLATAEFRYVQ